MATITQIELALKAKLQSLGYFKEVESIAEFLAKSADELAILAPSAYIAYQGRTFASPGMNTSKRDRNMVFAIVLVQRNFVSQEILLHGTASKKGIYDIVEEVCDLLIDEDLGLDITPIDPMKDDIIGGDQMVVIYGLWLETKTRR